MFCNGMVVLPDGRAFINGGTLAYDPFQGSLKSSVFDPATNTFTDVQNMAHGRWYPTVLTLGDGRIMTFSGFLETGGEHQHNGRVLHGRFGLEPSLYGSFHARLISPLASFAQRQSVLFRPVSGLPIVRPIEHNLDAECRNHKLRRFADVRKFSPAWPDAGEQLRPSYIDHGWRQPSDQDNRNHRHGSC